MKVGLGLWRSRPLIAAAAALAATLGLAACSASPSAHTPGAASTTLTIGVDNGSPTLQDNFNPFSPNQRIGTTYMYEPLEFVNPLNGVYTPFLATGHQWVNSTTLTFTIRSGMKWSNGNPITPADVVFTFDLLRRYPALDGAGIWSHVSTVTSQGQVVTFTFSGPDVPFAQVIAGTLIVPKQVWSALPNPTTFTNTSPVVSGPFVLASFNPNEYVLKKNPNCWQAAQVAVTKVNFPALTGNTTSQLTLSRGGYDWATLFIPEVRTTWVAKSPKYNNYWFPPGGVISLFLNTGEAPFSNTNFRRGISYALNRQQIATQAENGYVQPAAQTGLLLPNEKRWVDSTIPNQGLIAQNISTAKSEFAKAGFTEKNNQLVGANGQQVAFNVILPSGFSDWLRGAQTIKQELGAVGIDVTIQTPQYGAYYSAMSTGHYQGAIGAYGGSGSPAIDFNNLLSSSLSAPIGKPASTNTERWQSSSTDALLATLLSATSVSAQRSAVDALQQVMYSKLPVISLFYGATWGEYNTRNFTNWPSASNPYAPPAPYGAPPLMIMTHLKLR
ncbi:MAG: ABC transporter substrate-binding protein [Candidatus Dormibacteria bacterium]